MTEDSFEELLRPDERTLRFSPFGLGGRMSPEDSARFLRDSISRATLGPDVPEDVRDNFERVRQLHLYGVLEYEFFSAASDLAYLALEGALRVRFLSYYTDGVPIGRDAERRTLKVSSFDEVRAAKSKRWKLATGDEARPLPTTLRDLFAWARREQLLPGERTLVVDRALTALRNFAAHPAGYTLHMPPESARTLCAVAEIINRLWGSDTPGGRLFPPPDIPDLERDQ